MKRIILPLFLMMIVLVSSCNDEDDSMDNTATAGEWNLSELNYTGTSSNSGITYTYVGEALNIDNAVISLNNDNTYNSSGSYDVELITTFFGQSSTSIIPVDFSTLLSTGTWERNGNIMAFSSNGQTTEYTISNETSTHMEMDGTQTVSTLNGGGTSTLDYHIEYDR